MENLKEVKVHKDENSKRQLENAISSDPEQGRDKRIMSVIQTL